MKLLTASLLTLFLSSAALYGQTATETAQPSLAKLTDSWPTYNGDYSGRRYSPMTKINTTTVKQLSLAWTFRIETATAGGKRISATPLEVNGVLYFTVPSHVWAVDARSGRKLWQFDWNSKGGESIGNRGAAVRRDTVYFETDDCNLVAIDINTGKEKWHASIGNPDQFYFGSVAPVIVKNHVMVGVSGDDFDIPGYIEAHDPETGALQWRWYTHPNPGEPEAKTWPNDEAMLHGGGMTWVPGTYDPELNLYYFGTGNAQPVINGAARPGANLYTSTICALNPDTGKLIWYFQPNPHDTHDWDAVQTPVLIDSVIGGAEAQAAGAGQPQRMVLSSGSHEREGSIEHSLRETELDARRRCEGLSDSESSEDGANEWCASCSESGGSRQLVSAQLQPCHGTLLCAGLRCLQRLLHLRQQ